MQGKKNPYKKEPAVKKAGTKGGIFGREVITWNGKGGRGNRKGQDLYIDYKT